MSSFLFLNYADFTVHQEPGIGEVDRRAIAQGQLDILRFNGSLWRFERLKESATPEAPAEDWEPV